MQCTRNPRALFTTEVATVIPYPLSNMTTESDLCGYGAWHCLIHIIIQLALIWLCRPYLPVMLSTPSTLVLFQFLHPYPIHVFNNFSLRPMYSMFLWIKDSNIFTGVSFLCSAVSILTYEYIPYVSLWTAAGGRSIHGRRVWWIVWTCWLFDWLPSSNHAAHVFRRKQDGCGMACDSSFHLHTLPWGSSWHWRTL